MVIIDNDKYKEALERLGNSSNGRIPVSLDMFRDAENIIAETGYAIATNDKGQDAIVLGWFAGTYVHDYVYTGEIDTQFIDNYDCLFLHGCNEYSVELCRTALDKWKGTVLVLIGEDWQYVIDDLPEIPGVTCMWQDKLLKDFFEEVTNGRKYLHITIGLPSAESMKRYEDNIMTYDEVMTYTYLFANRKECGELNPDKKFWVFDANYGNLGIFNVFNKAVNCARYAVKKGFIPVPRLVNKRGLLGIYQDYEGDDIWDKFYKQPEGYSLEEVLKSKNVYFSPFFYNATIMQNLMDEYCKDVSLSWPDGIYNDRLMKYIEDKEKSFLPYPDKTLGVLARGTDYVNTHLSNHSIHASKEMICDKIDEALKEWNLEYIYLATEDEAYCKYFKERYGNKIFFTDQERYTVAPGELLGDMHRKNKAKREGFLLGAEYILSIYLLSKCSSMIASGGCAGVGEAKRMNAGEYANVYVFDIGKNE